MQGIYNRNQQLHNLASVIYSTQVALTAHYRLESVACQVVEIGLASITQTVEAHFKRCRSAVPQLVTKFLEGNIKCSELIHSLWGNIGELKAKVNQDLHHTLNKLSPDAAAFISDLELGSLHLDTTLMFEVAKTVSIEKTARKLSSKSIGKAIDCLPLGVLGKEVTNQLSLSDKFVRHIHGNEKPIVPERLHKMINELLSIQELHTINQLRTELANRVYNRLDQVLTQT